MSKAGPHSIWHGVSHRRKMELKREDRLTARQTWTKQETRKAQIGAFPSFWHHLRGRKGVGRPVINETAVEAQTIPPSVMAGDISTITDRQSQITPSQEPTDENHS